MPFKKGDKRPDGAGRKKGTPHKASLLVKEILENHGINLVEQIIVRLPSMDKKDQVDALLKLVPYCYPRLNAVEHSGQIANPYLAMPIEELEKEVKAKLKEKK